MLNTKAVEMICKIIRKYYQRLYLSLKKIYNANIYKKNPHSFRQQKNLLVHLFTEFSISIGGILYFSTINIQKLYYSLRKSIKKFYSLLQIFFKIVFTLANCVQHIYIYYFISIYKYPIIGTKGLIVWNYLYFYIIFINRKSLKSI